MSQFTDIINAKIVVSEDSITFYPPVGMLWLGGHSSIGFTTNNPTAAAVVLRMVADRAFIKDNR